MKGQVLFVILLLLLVILGYFVIIIGLSTLASFPIEEAYLDFEHLRSLTYSGIWLAFQWIKQSTSSLPATTESLSTGDIVYEVTVLSQSQRRINVTSTLREKSNSFMVYQGTADINTSTFDIVKIEGEIR